jgi:hypothetical protein
MRVQIYAEELTDETAIVKKDVEGKGTYYGVRVFLKSPDALHDTADDDDRSAVTFWVPKGDDGSNDFEHVAEALDGLCARLTEAYAIDNDLDTIPLKFPAATATTLGDA